MSDTTGGGVDGAGLLDGILAATAAEGRGFLGPAPAPVRPGASSSPEAQAIAELDRRIRLFLERILRHPRFVAMRARWSGLHRLASDVPPGGAQTIAVACATKRELVQELQRAPSLDATLCWKAMVDEGLDPDHPRPFGALLIDATWGAEAEDLDSLQLLGGIGSVAHCPILTNAAPNLLGQESWTTLPSERELARRMDGPSHARWRSFRQSEESRFVALALPSVRLAEADPTRSWTDHSIGAAWLLAESIAAGFERDGWGVPPPNWRAAGLDGRGSDSAGPLAIRIADPGLLAGMGLTAAVPLPGAAGTVALPERPTAHVAKRFDREAATQRAAARIQLDHVLASGRFAQAMTVIGHRLRRGGASPETVRKSLDNWVARYREGPDAPLLEARVDLQPGQPRSGQVLIAWLAPRVGGGAASPDGIALDIL